MEEGITENDHHITGVSSTKPEARGAQSSSGMFQASLEHPGTVEVPAMAVVK